MPSYLLPHPGLPRRTNTDPSSTTRRTDPQTDRPLRPLRLPSLGSAGHRAAAGHRWVADEGCSLSNRTCFGERGKSAGTVRGRKGDDVSSVARVSSALSSSSAHTQAVKDKTDRTVPAAVHSTAAAGRSTVLLPAVEDLPTAGPDLAEGRSSLLAGRPTAGCLAAGRSPTAHAAAAGMGTASRCRMCSGAAEDRTGWSWSC